MNTELNPIFVAKWKNLSENDCHEIVDPQERNTRCEIGFACSSKPTHWKGASDVDDAPASAS